MPTWDAAGWLVRFRDASERRKLNLAGPRELRDLRIEVFQNTLAAVKAGGYEPSYTWLKNAGNDHPQIVLNLSQTIGADTRFYSAEIPRANWGNGGRTRVVVLEGDTLVVARLIAQTEPETAILNMANEFTPGGGVYGGAGAQEEYLFRCSDYYRSLYQYAAPGAFDPAMYGITRAAVTYPLNKDFGGVFSRRVTVFRGPEEEGYPLLDKPWQANFIAVPGPRGVNGGDQAARQNLANKIRTILSIAAENGQRKLVLGALGCGAFACGAQVVSAAFKKEIESTEFSGAFDLVAFAIKPDHNDPLGNNIRESSATFA
jgi:uncharacterized protein (TIGR02452 family)